MQLICPRCHTNNRFGAERPAAPARFVCVGCREEFEAVVGDGVLRTVLPQDERGLAPFGSSAPEPDEDFFDILSIPQEPYAVPVAEAAPAQVLEDVFAVEPEAAESSQAPAPVEAAAEFDPPHVTESSAEPAASSPAQSVQAKAAPAAEVAAAGASASGRVPPPPSVDKYAVGMRVLRVSPAWLLLSSLGFFAVLLTLSWMSRPVGPVGEAVAAVGVKMPNQATNPALKAAPVAAPAAPEKPAPEAAKAPAPQPEAPRSSEGAGGGNFTVQVGSFNNPSEANQRVSQLRAAGFESRSVAVELPGRGTWFRVQVGRYATREEAAKAGAQMRVEGAAAAVMVTEVNEKK